MTLRKSQAFFTKKERPLRLQGDDTQHCPMGAATTDQPARIVSGDSPQKEITLDQLRYLVAVEGYFMEQ